jgi:hypothetical protein
VTSSSKTITVVVALFGAFVLAGCQALRSDIDQALQSDIDVVKDGVLAGHNTTTVGKALEGTFQDPKWKSFETPKQAVVVEFNGTSVFEALHKAGFMPSSEIVDHLRQVCVTSLGLRDAIKSTNERIQNLTEEGNQRDELSMKRYAEFLAQLHTVHPEYFASGGTYDLYKTNPQYYAHTMPNSYWTPAALVEGNRPEPSGWQDEQNKIGAIRQEIQSASQSLTPIADKINACLPEQSIPVRFQFILSADKKAFEIQYIDDKPFGGATPNGILAFVYQ